ncbi:hypothetical protein ACFSTC_50395 [Nonomuraea ferruginea]
MTASKRGGARHGRHQDSDRSAQPERRRPLPRHPPQQTFNHWARGYERGRPLLHVLPQPIEHRMATVPFVAMAEAYVLDALRAAGVKPRKIRPALERLQREFGQYVLVAPELATDGIDVLWDFSKTSPEGEGLIEGTTGQRVIREIVTDYLQYIVRAEDGYPAMLRLRHWAPSKIVVDPLRSFGQPIFRGVSYPSVGCRRDGQGRGGLRGDSR